MCLGNTKGIGVENTLWADSQVLSLPQGAGFCTHMPLTQDKQGEDRAIFTLAPSLPTHPPVSIFKGWE